MTSKELRDAANDDDHSRYDLLMEAATTIERLERDNAELREHLLVSETLRREAAPEHVPQACKGEQ